MSDIQELIGEEICMNCKFYLGPIVGMCGCPSSEFAKSLVHPAGWCSEFAEPTRPPCERDYAGRTHEHPRFPSGDCTICGALCTEGCKHELAVGEWKPRVE